MRTGLILRWHVVTRHVLRLATHVQLRPLRFARYIEATTNEEEDVSNLR
jgi:hypothetical protein